MWIKLMHWLFGFHYIAFQFGFDDIIRRVKTFPNGQRYAVAYWRIYYLRPDGTFENRGGKYRPLTWLIEPPEAP